MKILVTGAAGFIGSALCNELGAIGHNVVAIDNFSNYYSILLKKARIKEFLDPLNIKFINLDIVNDYRVNTLITNGKFDAVINLAAQAGVRLPVNETDKYVKSNLVGFSNVLRATIENKVPVFLYASSSSVYGNEAQLPYREFDQNLHPSSFYGASKLANELMTSTLVQTSATTARGLRFFTVYGPWGRPDMAYFRMIANIISDYNFDFYGDGTIERDFTYISDATNSIMNLLTELNSRQPGFHDVVNIGGGNPVSMNNLINMIEKLSNKKITYAQKQENLSDVKKTQADPSYLHFLTGRQPETSLLQGISSTLEWAMHDKIRSKIKKWLS